MMGLNDTRGNLYSPENYDKYSYEVCFHENHGGVEVN